MKTQAADFFKALMQEFEPRTVHIDTTAQEMMASAVDEEGWFTWKLVEGRLTDSDYAEVQKEFSIILPPSFIEWHKAYFFLDADCILLRLPASDPGQPLEELKENLNWYIPQQLIPQKLYPFACAGNDEGLLVFDGRISAADNEFAIRVYDDDYGGDLDGLSEVIFSSFPKLLQCMSHFLSERATRGDQEIIADFFDIDPQGAGATGRPYWQQWIDMLREEDEE